MKQNKLLAILLALTMTISLTACGGGDKDTSTDQQGDNVPLTREDNNAPLNREDTTEISNGDNAAGTYDPDMDLQSQIDSLNRNNLTPEQIAELEADAAEGGYEIDWNADGSLVIIEDGSIINTGGIWPENEFTADLPMPGKDMITASDVQENSCMIVMNWAAEDARAYAEELAKAGFDRGVEEQDLASMGVYTYTASNGEYTVSATFMSGSGGGIEIGPTDLEELEYRENNPDEFEAPVSDDDLQKQLEEAQKQLEGMDLPEGYEDVLGGMDLDEIDLGSLMGGES